MEAFQLDCISQVFKKEWKTACIGALLSVVLASIIISGFGWPNLEFPYCYANGYQGDSFGNLAYIQRYIEGAFFENARLGYPFGSNMAECPGWDGYSHIMLKLLSLFFNSPAAVLNIFILLSYITNFAACFIVMRSFKINVTWAFLGAILFNFIPFHYMRFHHFMYVYYFSIPIYFYIALHLYSSHNDQDWKSWFNNNKLLIILTIICSNLVVYYTFFGVIVLLTAGLGASVNHKSWKPFYKSIVYTIISALTVFIMLFPFTINKINNGRNAEIVERTYDEAERSPLKLSQLLLPSPEHRIESLQKITNEYNNKTALFNENKTATLGFFGSLGFLSLIGLMFFMQTERKLDSRLTILSTLTLMMLLTATVGGFSVLFGMFISPFIRGWSRISLFVGFASITAMCILLEKYFHDKFSPKLINIGCGMISVLCFLDQTPSEQCVKEGQNQISQRFTQDKKFVQSIEAIVPPGSPIFQYPYIQYPEGGTYEHMIVFIHSKTLSASFGGMRGREGDAFYRALDKESLNKQLDVMKKLGFQGIYIDKGFYKDGGQEIVQKYSLLLGKNPDITSDNGRFVFFKLNDVPQFKLNHLLHSEIMKRADYYPGIKNDATNQALLREMMYGVLR